LDQALRGVRAAQELSIPYQLPRAICTKRTLEAVKRKLIRSRSAL
jgi:hypothetical protein